MQTNAIYLEPNSNFARCINSHSMLYFIVEIVSLMIIITDKKIIIY